ncbi:MAG: DMT family transporter [Burkholderiaceae bacterium]
MTQKLTPSTILLLLVPPLLWAGNAVLGRVVIDMVPPLTLNFLRWVAAFIILLPLGHSVLRRGSGLWRLWKRYALLGLLGVGLYNTLQYMALHTSTPINVTLVAASMPLWMMLIGLLFFGTRIGGHQLAGVALSMAGVLVVLSHGQWQQLLAMRFVAGDIFMIVAAIVWAFYSWLLTRDDGAGGIRRSWATLLLAQIFFGVLWSGGFAAGEWALTDAQIHWSWGLGAALLYFAVGPSIVAYRCWGAGVGRVGPTVAGFFNNLMPLFAALMSAAFLGETPQAYHAVAFLLIVGGIVLSSRYRPAA